MNSLNTDELSQFSRLQMAAEAKLAELDLAQATVPEVAKALQNGNSWASRSRRSMPPRSRGIGGSQLIKTTVDPVSRAPSFAIRKRSKSSCPCAPPSSSTTPRATTWRRMRWRFARLVSPEASWLICRGVSTARGLHSEPCDSRMKDPKRAGDVTAHQACSQVDRSGCVGSQTSRSARPGRA